MKSIYLAGPMSGMDGKTCYNDFATRAAQLRRLQYTVYNPVEGKEFLVETNEPIQAMYEVNPMATPNAIFHKDMALLGRSDILLAVLDDATRPSIGTTGEICVAARSPNPPLIIVTGLHEGHCMWHPFIKAAASIELESYEAARAYLEQMAPSWTGHDPSSY